MHSPRGGSHAAVSAGRTQDELAAAAEDSTLRQWGALPSQPVSHPQPSPKGRERAASDSADSRFPGNWEGVGMGLP